MSQDTKIEWADDTVNFWWGCSEVSPACDNCYARILDARRKHGGKTHWGPEALRWLRDLNAVAELKRNDRLAKAQGIRRRQFINSMSDFFEDREDLDAARLAALDAFRQCLDVDILLLTKRPQRILHILPRLQATAGVRGMPDLAKWLQDWLSGKPPMNVWVGTTVENQKWANTRLDHLCCVPAVVRFVSYEPALGPVDFSKWFWRKRSGKAGLRTGLINWFIAGGESGAKAREMLPTWAQSARDQCVAAGIAFHFKQWGEFCRPSQMPPETLRALQEKRDCESLPERPYRVHKKHAGRLLDGHEWNGLPKIESPTRSVEAKLLEMNSGKQSNFMRPA